MPAARKRPGTAADGWGPPKGTARGPALAVQNCRRPAAEWLVPTVMTFAATLPAPLDCRYETARFSEKPDAPRPAAIRPRCRRPARATDRGICRGATRLRSMARRLSRARTGQRHLGRDLYPRHGPDRTGYDRVQADAEAAGVQRADMAIHQSPRLGLAHHRRQGSAEEERGAVCADRTGLWGRARHAAGAVGRRIRLRRSAGAAEPHAPRVSIAGGTRLERTAPPRL